jgi:Putative beta barrel porin-7 (BBP7)
MRIGLHTIRLLALLAAATVGGELCAQSGGGSTYQPPQFSALDAATSMRPMQAMYMQPMAGGANPYQGASGVVPAGYCGNCYGGDCCGGDCYGGECGCGDCYGDCGYPPCGDCYGQGPSCATCGPYGGGPSGVCHYGNGGSWQDCRGGTNPPFPDDVEDYSLLPPGRTEQCGPHYFDVRMEAIYMTRDETFKQQVDFTSQNVAGPIVLSSSQLDFDPTTGFRIMGRYDIGPLAVIEFGYWGIQDLSARAHYNNSNADSYSLFSDFVRQPADLPATVTSAGGALPWTERSVVDRISLESELQNAEFNYRRYWVGFSPAVSGTLLAGFRYTRLREDFQFYTMGAQELTFDPATGSYDENIKNDMAGFQAGGDIWIHVRQGVRIGAEGKVGLMNNHYTLDNTFTAVGENDNSGPPPNFTEHFEKDIPALVTEASADVVWDILPSWSIRAGYEITFLNSVLLAGENFNTGTVYNGVTGVNLPERVPFVNEQGHAFYHGAHLGAEFTW